MLSHCLQLDGITAPLPATASTNRYRMIGMGTAHRRHLVIVSLLAIGLADIPSYVRAFKLTSSSAAPTINIGGSFLVMNRAACIFRLPIPVEDSMIPQQKSAAKTLRPERPQAEPVRNTEKEGAACQSQ
jgi:hypothetical protein